MEQPARVYTHDHDKKRVGEQEVDGLENVHLIFGGGLFLGEAPEIETPRFVFVIRPLINPFTNPFKKI